MLKDCQYKVTDNKNSSMGSLGKVGPCGGCGGSDQDMDISGINRVIMVVVYHDLTIDNISILYESNGQKEWTSKWGGGLGTRSEICLDTDEYFTSVTGYVGKYDDLTVVRSLTFVSNLRSYGPFGREEGALFQLPAISGKIIGFHARSGALLDVFGTYVITD